MKDKSLALLISLAVCFSLAVAGALPRATPAAETGLDVGKIPELGVDALLRAPDKYPGTIRVRGVVASVFPKEQRLGLLDAGYVGCCPNPCGQQALPVRWAGDMPRPKAQVTVTGEVRKDGGKVELAASAVEPVEATGGAAK